MKKILVIGILTIIFIVFLIFLPPLFGLANEFNATNYYQLISGIIAGVITIFALIWQFTNEREKLHEENKINARGFFEINYLLKAIDEIKPYVCLQNIEEEKSGSIINLLCLNYILVML